MVFFCDGEVVSKKIRIGEEENNDAEPLLEENIQTSYITTLNKIANMSSNVIIYMRRDGMINIIFDILSLGEFTIFIKSKRLINIEEEENEDDDE